MSLKLRKQNHPSLQGCFSGMPLIPVLIFGGQNVLKIFEMTTRHNRRTTRTELDRVFCRWIYFHLRSKLYSDLLTGALAPLPSPPQIRHWLSHAQTAKHKQVATVTVANRSHRDVVMSAAAAGVTVRWGTAAHHSVGGASALSVKQSRLPRHRC